MPGKPRHRRDKRLPQSKRRTGLGQSATVAWPPVPAQTQEPIARPKEAVTSANVSVPTAKPSATPYPHITRELRTIALLAGSMLLILIVVAFISR